MGEKEKEIYLKKFNDKLGSNAQEIKDHVKCSSEQFDTKRQKM
jgi:hypothetical protein